MVIVFYSLLYCIEFRLFWVSWGSGIIWVGEGWEMGIGMFMEWFDLMLYLVNFLGFLFWSIMMFW